MSVPSRTALGAYATRLAVAARDVVRPPPRSPDEERRFVEFCAVQTAVQVRALSAMFVVGILAWWPFDTLIFAGHPEVLDALLRWRLATLALMAIIHAFFTWSPPVIARPWLSYTIAAVAVSLTFSVVLAGEGGPTYPFVQNCYLLTIPSFAYLGPIGRRTATSVLTLGAWGVATFTRTPEIRHVPFLGNTVGLTIFALFVAIVTGHIFFLLRRQNFMQQLALDRRARELEELDRAKSELFAHVSTRLRTQVRAQTEELRTLAAERSSALETDRARIARDIHDELGQALTGMRLEVAWLHGHTGDARGLEAGLGRLDAILDETFASARRILMRLRPRLLDEAGLPAATRWLVEEFQRRTGVACSLDVQLATNDRLGGEATAIFRIVQEALTNAARHAGARHVEVVLRQDAAGFVARIRDDGQGFDVAAAFRAGRGGLHGMRERAREFDGDLTIDGGPGAGTTVTLTLPPPGEAGV